MAEPTAAHARELGDYLLIARRRWRWIVGAAPSWGWCWRWSTCSSRS